MGWPIARDSFEDVDDLFYDFTADELGIDPKTANMIEVLIRDYCGRNGITIATQAALFVEAQKIAKSDKKK